MKTAKYDHSTNTYMLSEPLVKGDQSSTVVEIRISNGCDIWIMWESNKSLHLHHPHWGPKDVVNSFGYVLIDKTALLVHSDKKTSYLVINPGGSMATYSNGSLRVDGLVCNGTLDETLAKIGCELVKKSDLISDLKAQIRNGYSNEQIRIASVVAHILGLDLKDPNKIYSKLRQLIDIKTSAEGLVESEDTLEVKKKLGEVYKDKRQWEEIAASQVHSEKLRWSEVAKALDVSAEPYKVLEAVNVIKMKVKQRQDSWEAINSLSPHFGGHTIDEVEANILKFKEQADKDGSLLVEIGKAINIHPGGSLLAEVKKLVQRSHKPNNFKDQAFMLFGLGPSKTTDHLTELIKEAKEKADKYDQITELIGE